MHAVIKIIEESRSSKQAHAFISSITKYNADFGILVAFNKYLTKEMQAAAENLGTIDITHKSGTASLFHHKQVKKLYILSIEDLMANNFPQELLLLSLNVTY